MRKLIAVTEYNFKALYRNFRPSAIMFILPAFFMLIFGIIFGAGDDIRSYNIGILSTEGEQQTAFQEALAEIPLRDEGEERLFNISKFDDEAEAETAVKNENILLYLKFTAPLESSNIPFSITTYGRPNSQTYFQLSSVIEQFTAEFFQVETGYFNTGIVNVDEQETISGFEYLAPGLIVYSMLILIPGVAERFATIRENGQLFRYKISRIRAIDILGGTAIFYMVISVLQVLISIFVAGLFGFDPKGSIFFGLLIAIPTSLFIIGLGLLFGAMGRTSEEATNIGTLVSVVLGFLSGSFIADVGRLFEFNIAGNQYQFNDFLPSKWATTAMEQVLRDGMALSEIYFELSIITISSLVVFILGVIYYSLKHLRSSA